MNEKQRACYRLNEAKAQARLNEWLDTPENTGDLTRELALARSLVEQAVQSGNTSLAKDLLGCISNLNKAHRIEQLRTSELLQKSVVIRLGYACAEIIGEEFSDVPGWEERLARASERISLLISGAKNDEPLRLEAKE